MIKQVVFAASHDEARPILTGVLITVEDNTLTWLPQTDSGCQLELQNFPILWQHQ